MKRAVSSLFLLLTAAACMPPYEPPTAAQPHAVIKLRRTYETTAGTHLTEAAEVDEHYVLKDTSSSRIAQAPLTDSFLAHPIAGTFSVHSNFHHQEMQMVHESYQVSHTDYRMESYDCSSGFGTNKSYRTCSRTVPHTVYETKYRNVMKSVEVSDGACGRYIRFLPKADHVYLLQYTYQAPSACDLSCFEQLRGADGGFKNMPCPAAPPAEDD
jgi:hypothetical protein